LVLRNLDPGPAQSKVGLNAMWLVRKGISPRELSIQCAPVFLCKSIPNGAQYVTPAKIFLTSMFSYFLLCNPTNKTETGTAHSWELLIANHLDQSLWLTNKKQGSAVTSYLLHSF
jgi:hypothetical protein